MKILKIYAAYKQFCADAESLERLKIWAKDNEECRLLQLLSKSNRGYRQDLVSLVQDNFPATATDVKSWSESEWECWLDLLLEHPVFWQGKQEMMIGLFWSLDNKGTLTHTDKVALLCTHLEMVDYAADFRNKSVADTLNVLIEKYATLVQAEVFQGRVDLKVNDIY